MEPEIARRCGYCGAAVRGRARFCPQCGQTMGEQTMSEAPTLNRRPASADGEAQASDLPTTAERIARELNERLPPETRDAFLPPAANETDTPVTRDAVLPSAPAAHEARAPVTRDVILPPNDSVPAHDASRAATMRERAGERVGRLREASVVVLDEAQDDPALRFVLVAAALFVIFLLILLFSYVLR
jgi:hypothetical protein